MKTVRWGLIGAGNISSKFAKALNSLENTQITAIASRDIVRARDFAERFHVEKAYGSYEEMVREPEIDVIYIGTPHTEHRANAKLCIINKKAVLCEKPFTLNCEEARELAALARENDVFLMEAMWTKLLPATRVVKHWVENKLVGDVRFMNLSFGYQAEFDPLHRLFHAGLGGGALLDVGIYPISYVTYLMGRMPDQVVSSAILGRSGVDEINSITMKYQEGMLAGISSAITANTGSEAVIIGDRGRIIVPDFWTAESAEAYDSNGKLIDTFLHPFTSNGYVYEAEEVNRCIREGRKESDRIPLADTLEVMQLLDDIRADWGLVYPSEVRP